MNWQAQRSNRKAIGLTAAASAAIAALGLVPATAQAQGADNATVTNGASVTLLTPFPGTAFSGSKQIEISAFYQDASASGGITTVEISIDGQSAAVKKLDRPELRGVVSFLIDPTTLDLGSHQILIKVSSLSGEHSSVRTSIRYNGDDSSKPQALPSMDSVTSAAGIMVLSPRPSDHVSGIVTIKVNAIDPTGRAPYVSVFIDKVFKSLRNHPPYTFDWDTTRTTNGWHTIEVSGFNDDEQLGKAEPVRVYVNNGGGDTTIDRALTDTPAPQMSKSTPAAEPAANVVSADDARLAKTTPETPAIAATAPAKLASASVDDGTLTDQILLSAPFLQKKTIPAPETTISSSTATLARPREQAPSVIIRSIEPLATVTDPGAIAATPSLTAPAVARIKKQAASAPAPAAGSAELVRTQPVAASPAFTQPNITPVAPVSSGLTGAQAVAPVVSAKPIEASAPSAPAELAAGTRPDAAVTYSSPKMSVSTAEAAVSPDAHAVAPVVSVKPIEASAPSAPAELAAGTRPDAAVTYSSPKMSVSTAEAAVSPDAHAVAPVVSAKPIEASAPSAPAELAAGTRPDAAVTYSSPKMSVSTADAAVSPDAHAVAPIVSAKPIEASAPSAPAELAAGTRPDAAVTYSSPKMSVSTADAAVSPDAHAVAPIVSAKPIEASAPLVPAELAAAVRPDAAVTYSSPKMSVSTADATVSPDAHAEAPVLVARALPASEPSVPAEFAKSSRPDAVVTLPPSALRTSTPDTAASQDAHAVAPVVSTKPIEESVPVAPAELAHKSAAQPAVSVGSQILASAGYTPSRVDPNIVLKAPFMLKKPEFAPPTDTPPENATLAHPSAMSPQIPSVTYAMASTKLSVSPVSSQSLDAPSVSKEAAPMSAPSLATGARRAGVVVAPAPSKMASAAVNISPDGTGSLSLPSFAAPRTDMTNVPHASVLVARPASGLFSASVRHKLAGQYEVVMDDRSVALDRPIQDHGNVLCAPIRQIVESQGGVLFWSQKTKSVRALTPNRDIQLQIGSTLAKVNDQDQKLSTAPYVTGGRTMIPVGFLPLALNVVVNYDAATGHLQIDSKD